MAIFVKVAPAQGGDPIYRNETTNKVVSAEELAEQFPAVKEELDLADAGTQIDSDTVTKGEGDGVVDANGKSIEPKKATKAEEEDDDTPKKPATKRATKSAKKEEDDSNDNPYSRPVPSSEEGMGFPRKGGKTVDIFDGETPHTHLRLVEGMPVPVSEENYRTKTDSEIYDRLKELKLV